MKMYQNISYLYTSINMIFGLSILCLSIGIVIPSNAQTFEPPPVITDEANFIFGFTFGDKFKEAFQEGKEIGADRLSELLALECAITYKGKKAIEGRMLIFFASDGKPGQVISSNTLRLEPSVEEPPPVMDIPARKFEEAFTKTFRSKQVSASLLIPEAEYPVHGEVFSEGDYEEVLYEKINWKHMKNGIGMLFIPERKTLNEIGRETLLVPAILMIGETEKN